MCIVFYNIELIGEYTKVFSVAILSHYWICLNVLKDILEFLVVLCK